MKGDLRIASFLCRAYYIPSGQDELATFQVKKRELLVEMDQLQGLDERI